MKTLIATTILLIAGTAANAGVLSRFDPQEFYTGIDTGEHPTINPGIALNNDNLFLEGHFPHVTPSAQGHPDGKVCET
jgi:hypothetical protein